MDFFKMLNGPTYTSLVRQFWVRVHVDDKHAAKLEETEKIQIDPTLEGKSREETGLEPFRCTEIRSSIMGIPVFISEDSIAFVIKRASEGSYKGGIGNNKPAPGTKCMEKKMLLKIQNENLLPKGGGNDQPSLEHRILLHFFITGEQANVPRYIFKHMIKDLRDMQEKKRCWVPYGRLILEIIHQGGILKALSKVNFFTDEQLGTETGKVINGKTLRNMSLFPKDAYTELSTDLKKSNAISNLMEDFPPICKQDPLEVHMNFIKVYFALTGKKIRLEDVPETMYGGALPVVKSRKTKRKAITKNEYLDDDAHEQLAKKAKKDKKAAVQENIVEPEVVKLPLFHRLLLINLQSQRIRESKLLGSKSWPYVAEDEEQIAAATNLITREVRKKKVEDDATLHKVLQLATEIKVPVSSITREDVGIDAQEVIKAVEVVQQLVATEAGSLLTIAEEVQEIVGCLEAAVSEASKVMTSSEASSSEASYQKLKITRSSSSSRDARVKASKALDAYSLKSVDKVQLYEVYNHYLHYSVCVSATRQG
ncbi:hypothetical protein MTR_8g468090 [Medicago truncatula]|uniref:Uncharacterized protein n=1 Tax=Medicago truncatula TaxID=3880 RepID=A0A072TRD1_MEDTR|nr:hypothetical protein MTR_8g468090 [Medicago truncatula]